MAPKQDGFDPFGGSLTSSRDGEVGHGLITRFGTIRLKGELMRFGVSTLASASITILLPILLHATFHVEPVYAVMFAFAAAFTANFLLMRLFVFAHDEGLSRSLLRYTTSNLTFRCMEYALIFILITEFHAYYAIATVLVLAVSAIAKFCVYRSFVFRSASVPSPREHSRHANPVDALLFATASVMALLGLMLPALVNGRMILFPDSIGYYEGGKAIYLSVRQAIQDHRVMISPSQISDARSVFYGLPMFILYRFFGEWAVCLCQSSFAVAVMVMGAIRLGVSTRCSFGIVAAVALITGIGFFSSAAMPDLFAGFMILGAAILIGQWADLKAGEKATWLAVVIYGMLVHKGHILVLAVVVGVMGSLLLARGKLMTVPFLALCATILAAVSGFEGVDVATQVASGQPPKKFPFLLARAIGDGTARSFLDEECARTPYFLCRDRQRLTMSENDFLWSRDPGVGLYRLLDPTDKARVDAEAGSIVRGAILNHPLRQSEQTALRMVRTVFNVGVTRYGVTPSRFVESDWPLFLAYNDPPITNGRIPLVAISWWMRAVYGIAFAILLSVAAVAPHSLSSLEELAITRQTIVVGVIANACVFGAISSLADRYQGRVAWLFLFAALATLCTFKNNRWSRVQPGARA